MVLRTCIHSCGYVIRLWWSVWTISRLNQSPRIVPTGSPTNGQSGTLAADDALMAERTDSELRKAARHVAHDVRMLARAYTEHGHSAFAWTAWFVHCRSVMEFFGDDARYPDDIVVSHFLPSGTTWGALTKLTQEPVGYDGVREAANKLAGHLTYSRLEYEKGGSRNEVVPSEEITNYLLGLTHLFLDALPSERKVWFGGLWR